jgi:hypothetical protein
MAGASFNLAVRPDSTPEQRKDYSDKTLIWAQRALELDPELGETNWFLAGINQRLATLAHNQGDEAAAGRFQKQAAGYLSRIKPGSPRYPKAQQALQQYGAPKR